MIEAKNSSLLTEYWGGGSTTSDAALLGEWCVSDPGGNVPEQEEIYKANCLDLREARHKHERL